MKKLDKLILYSLLFLVQILYAHTSVRAERLNVNLKKTNFLVLRDEINGPASSKLIMNLNKFRNKPELYLYIISGGGSVFSGMSIIETILTLHDMGVNVTCIANTAFSMAYVVFQY